MPTPVASWCIAICMVSALNASRRTSVSCPRFILASDSVWPPVLTLWFLPHAGLHLATAYSRSQELEGGMRYRPVSPPHHLSLHSGDSWRHFFSSDNCINNTNYCVVVLECLALSTTLILANWTELWLGTSKFVVGTHFGARHIFMGQPHYCMLHKSVVQFVNSSSVSYCCCCCCYYCYYYADLKHVMTAWRQNYTEV